VATYSGSTSALTLNQPNQQLSPAEKRKFVNDLRQLRRCQNSLLEEL